MSESFSELRALTDEQLIEKHDQRAKTTTVGTQHYLDELNRRHQDRQTEAMLGYTRQMLGYTDRMHGYTNWIKRMTIAITVATLTNLGIAVGMLAVMIRQS